MLIVARVGAVVLGLLTFLAALMGSFGTAILVPIGMVAGRGILRRRGVHVGLLHEWISGVMTFGAIICLLAIGGVAAGPLRAPLAHMQAFTDSVQQHPAPPPEFLRRLGATQPAPIPGLSKPILDVSMILGIEAVCLFMGTVAWAGCVLLIYGFRGPRSAAPVDVPA